MGRFTGGLRALIRNSDDAAKAGTREVDDAAIIAGRVGNFADDAARAAGQNVDDASRSLARATIDGLGTGARTVSKKEFAVEVLKTGRLGAYVGVPLVLAESFGLTDFWGEGNKIDTSEISKEFKEVNGVEMLFTYRGDTPFLEPVPVPSTEDRGGYTKEQWANNYITQGVNNVNELAESEKPTLIQRATSAVGLDGISDALDPNGGGIGGMIGGLLSGKSGGLMMGLLMMAPMLMGMSGGGMLGNIVPMLMIAGVATTLFSGTGLVKDGISTVKDKFGGGDSPEVTTDTPDLVRDRGTDAPAAETTPETPAISADVAEAARLAAADVRTTEGDGSANHLPDGRTAEQIAAAAEEARDAPTVH